MALDFNFTDEQKMLEDSVYKWAVSWLEPQMEHLYEVDEMPPTLFKELGNLGINGIVFEEKYGAPSVIDGQVWRWIGKTVSIDLDGDVSSDRQRLVKAVADAACDYELETAQELIMMAYKSGVRIPEAEAENRQRRADAERHHTEFLSGKYGAFTITTNTFSSELKDREKKKAAGVL